jgi:uncharacterized protein (DUF58 family)
MFTSNGKAVAILAVLLLGTGALLDYPELVALGVACVVALAIATMWISARPNVVAVRDIAPARVSEGDRSRAVLTVTNRSPRRSPPIAAEERVGRQVVTVTIPSLGSQRSHTASYDLPTSRRGIFNVGPLTIGQSDPLRLMRVGRAFASRSQLWVYPRIHQVRAVPTGHSRDTEGPTSSTATPGGVAFHAIRDYVWGDDFRLIHWKSTARTGTLQVRQMVVPDQPRVLIVLDTSAEPYVGESFEDAVRVAGSLAAAASRRGFPVQLRTTAGSAVAMDKTGDGLVQIMDLLAGVTTNTADPGLRELIRMMPDEPGVSLAVVTGQPSNGRIASVGTVRSRFEMVSLAQVGELHGRPASLPAGVVGVNVRTSEDFVSAWNRLVRH